MPNMAGMTVRQLLILWAVGLLLILVTFIGSSFLVVPYQKARMRQFALRDTGQRQVDPPRAAEVPTDTSQTARAGLSRNEQASRRLKASQDSLMAAQIIRQPEDTIYNAYNESPAALQRALFGVKLLYAALAMCIVMPLLLLGTTGWWAYNRRRARSPRGAA